VPHFSRFPLLATPLLLAACNSFLSPELAQLAQQPVSDEPRSRGTFAWNFHGDSGTRILTRHYDIHTAISDPIFQHLLVRTLEAGYDRNASLTQIQIDKPLDCYVFSSRAQWESYTREHAGVSAPIYLQIASGGYSQQGVVAAYDIGRSQTLSVIAHESWHQYSWFAFKDRLPSWLEEGLATQNEAITWENAQPLFQPQKNTTRLGALRRAVRDGTLFPLADLVSTHAGRVIKLSQARVDAYYAQLWSFVFFLKQSPLYGPRLQRLLADAARGTLTQALAGTSVTPEEIAAFSEHWNLVAGPVYLQKYLSDIPSLEHEYIVWLQQFLRND
jgi:hypothetical protein